MAETKKAVAGGAGPGDGAAARAVPVHPAASFINLLYDNFVEKWNKTITAANYLVKLKSIFDQQPPDVHLEIAPGDTMFVPEWRDHYFHVGQLAFRCIKTALVTAEKLGLRRILDLPCGHGRVLRVLRAAFPDAEITACDLDKDGVDFCARTFGAIPVYSAENPALIPVQGPFDLIWCGSLLTHLDKPLWLAFFDFFQAQLNPGGILVFTVHGREAAHWIRSGKYDYGLSNPQALLQAYDQHGFSYQHYPAHTLRNYGISLSAPAWVLGELLKRPDLRLVNYTEKGCDNHQDVVACVKT